MSINLTQIRKKEINEKYLSNGFDTNDYNNHNTIILKSSTGTGKTYTLNKIIKDDLKRGKLLLNIFDNKALGFQIYKYFVDNNPGQKASHYKIDTDFNKNFANSNCFVCTNSLMRLYDGGNIEKLVKEMRNRILYIDEISLFCGFVNNGTIKNMVEIFYLLKLMIDSAYKVVVSQSHISPSVYELLKDRINAKPLATLLTMGNEKHCLLVDNKFRKSDVKAYIYSNEEAFLDSLIQDYRDQKYFVFACDSARVVSEIYNNFIGKIKEEDISKCYLFTKKTDTIDFKKTYENSYIFYSPTIMAGYDFSYDYKMTQYLYVKGVSVDASRLYQMANRVRNMSSLKVFFSSRCKDKERLYLTLENCREIVSEKKRTILKSFNMNPSTSVLGEMFYDLYCVENYYIDHYNSCKKKVLQKLLEDDGYKLFLYNAEAEKKDKINPNKILTKSEISPEMIEMFNRWIERKVENKSLENKAEILHIQTESQKREYRDILLDDAKLERHFRVCTTLMKTNELQDVIIESKDKNFDESLLTNQKVQIMFLKSLCDSYEIELFNRESIINHITYEDGDITLTDKEKEGMETILKSRREKPIANRYDLVKMVISSLNKLIPKLFTGTKNRARVKNSDGKRDERINYTFAYETIEDDLKLLALRTNGKRHIITFDDYIDRTNQDSKPVS